MHKAKARHKRHKKVQENSSRSRGESDTVSRRAAAAWGRFVKRGTESARKKYFRAMDEPHGKSKSKSSSQKLRRLQKDIDREWAAAARAKVALSRSPKGYLA